MNWQKICEVKGGIMFSKKTKKSAKWGIAIVLFWLTVWLFPGGPLSDVKTTPGPVFGPPEPVDFFGASR